MNWNKIIAAFMFWLVIVGLLYISFAIGNWSLSIPEWTEVGRIMFAVFFFIGTMIVLVTAAKID